MLDSGTPVQIVDARPPHYYASQDIMAGAVWHNPERLDRMDGRPSEERAGGRFLRLRLSCGMHHRGELRGGSTRVTWQAVTPREGDQGTGKLHDVPKGLEAANTKGLDYSCWWPRVAGSRRNDHLRQGSRRRPSAGWVAGVTGRRSSEMGRREGRYRAERTQRLEAVGQRQRFHGA